MKPSMPFIMPISELTSGFLHFFHLISDSTYFLLLRFLQYVNAMTLLVSVCIS